VTWHVNIVQEICFPFESRKFIVAITKSKHCSLSRATFLIRTIETNFFKVRFNNTLTSIFIPTNLLKLYLKILYDILISLTLFILTSKKYLISNLYVRLASCRLEMFKFIGVKFSSLKLYISKEIYCFTTGLGEIKISYMSQKITT
jgi:hypothetical protein